MTLKAQPSLSPVEAQIFTSDNTLSGQTLTVSSSTGGLSNGEGFNELDAATFGDGNVLLVWVDSLSQNTVIRGRIVSPEGDFITDDFIISESDNFQLDATALTLSNGDVLVLWSDVIITAPLTFVSKARTISLNSTLASLGSEYSLTSNENELVSSFDALQTETGRVVIGFDKIVRDSNDDTSFISDIASFCPVGCE